MPLVSHTSLPTFQRLLEEGELILSPEQAFERKLPQLRVGLLNMMPDAALEATERQFYRLVNACTLDVQFCVYPFTISGLERGVKAQQHIEAYYESFASIKAHGLDALIISGANVTHNRLQEESFWRPLAEVFDWAKEHVTSILCSCLATHALIQYEYGIVRTRLSKKRWGVFSHDVLDGLHPLLADIPSSFDVPHSRFNEIYQQDIEAKGLRVLVASPQAGVHLAVSADGFHVVFFQGHPEYDDISLLKEYKREVIRFFLDERTDYPPFPECFFDQSVMQLLDTYRQQLAAAKVAQSELPEFPEERIFSHLKNSWRNPAKATFNNWLRLVWSDDRSTRLSSIDVNSPESQSSGSDDIR